MAEKQTKQEVLTRFRMEGILAATRKVIEEHGSGFTLERVAEEAGVAKGTIYLYFPSKEELVFSVIKESLDEIIETSRQVLDSGDPLPVRLERALITQIQHVDANRKIFLYFHSLKGGSRHATKKDIECRMQSEYDTYVDMLAAHFERGVAEGEVRALNPHRLALVFTGMVDAVLANWVLSESESSIEEEARFVLDLLFRGMAPSGEGQ